MAKNISKHLDIMPRDTQDQYKYILEKNQKMIFRDFSIIFCTSPGLGCRKCHSASVPFWLGTLPSAPDSRGDISALRQSWKMFLGSKFAYASSTTRKTKQLMVLATPEKVITKCQKKCRMSETIVIASRISVVECSMRLRDSARPSRARLGSQWRHPVGRCYYRYRGAVLVGIILESSRAV